MKNGRFHQHLRDSFAPLVVRYVDLMESSIGQSILKGFEKERWEPKGWVSMLQYSRARKLRLFNRHCFRYYSNGCATSEDLFWKLDALQSFIRDLHWPDEEFRMHLEQRLKLMACEMIESCVHRWVDEKLKRWIQTIFFFSENFTLMWWCYSKNWSSI